MSRPIIGMTEAGDAGRDLSWYGKLINSASYAGSILITKYGSNTAFQTKALDMQNNHKPCIIHFGVTGWGGSAMEPNVPQAEPLLNSVRNFIDSGFPAGNCVIRIDPIIPNSMGIQAAVKALRMANGIVPDVKRIRLSIYDDYHKSRKEIIRRGYAPIDNVTKWKNETERRPTPDQIKMVAEALISEAPSQIFELCAEPELEAAYPDHFKWQGCLSKTDCDIMGISIPTGTGINGQNRFGCRCLMMKRELLSNKKRCPNNCAYCYWGRN